MCHVRLRKVSGSLLVGGPAVHEMMMMGAIVLDLGIERTVNKSTSLLFLDA